MEKEERQIKYTVFLPFPLWMKLREKAFFEMKTMADIVRDAIKIYLEGEDGKGQAAK